jgi:hypothetical protein
MARKANGSGKVAQTLSAKTIVVRKRMRSVRVARPSTSPKSVSLMSVLSRRQSPTLNAPASAIFGGRIRPLWPWTIDR